MWSKVYEKTQNQTNAKENEENKKLERTKIKYSECIKTDSKVKQEKLPGL